ncbi:MAG: marine proteobacterial sortase target protein [Kiloniellaceae bacterium]
MRHHLQPSPSHPLAAHPLAIHRVVPPRLGRTLWRNLAVLGAVMGAGLALVLVAMLASLPVRAQDAASPELPAGLYFPTGEDGSGAAGRVLEAPTLKTAVDLEVNGMVSRVSVRQVFHNPTRRWLEGIYVFPLPERAAVDRLTLRIGDRTVEGRIMEKAEAERAYKEAAATGQRASMVSGERPNVFVTAVANIGPGEDITVEIGYQDAVAYNDGVFSLRFPMVVAPRYTPAPKPAAVAGLPDQPAPAPAAMTGPDNAPRDLFGPVDIDPETANPLSLTLHLNAGMPLASLRSLYHPVVIESGEDGSQTLTLQAGQVPADRDFVVEWKPAPSAAPQTAVFAEQVGADTHLLVMMVPPVREGAPVEPQTTLPRPALPQPAQPREVIFVIDTSGSMFGDSLDQAKAAVVAALKRLKPEDRFNVLQFNDDTHALFPHPAAATVGNVARAWYYVSALEAEGGTEMLPALERALDTRHLPAPGSGQGSDQAPQGRSEGRFLRQVVFLTDAGLSNEEDLFRTVAAQLGDSRLFTVGIGSAPNSYFMRKAAELGRGSFTYIGDLSEVESRVDALLTKLEQPVLTDLRVGWPLNAGKRIEIYPTPLPDLYAGEPVTFTARLEGVDLESLDGQLLITGNSAQGGWQQRLPLGNLTPAPGTAAVWARAKLVQIEDGLYRASSAAGQGVDQAAIRAEALAVALEHQLVTRYTALVAIDAAVARPEGEDLQSAEIPRDLPAGWAAGKVFGQEMDVQEEADTAGFAADPTAMRSRAMPAPLLQRVQAAGGQPITLPQTATPAERMAIVGSAYLFLALALILLVMVRRRREGPRGCQRG